MLYVSRVCLRFVKIVRRLGVKKIVTSYHRVGPMRNIPRVIIKLYTALDVIYDLRTCLPLFYRLGTYT